MPKNRYARRLVEIPVALTIAFCLVACGAYNTVQGQQLAIAQKAIESQRNPGAVRVYLDALPESHTVTYTVAQEQFRSQPDPAQAVLDQVRKDIAAEYGDDSREVALATAGAFLSTNFVPNFEVYKELYDRAEKSGEEFQWGLLEDRAKADLKFALANEGKVTVLKR